LHENELFDIFAAVTKLKNTDLKEALAAAEAELTVVLKRADTLREWIIVTRKLCAPKGSKHVIGPEVAPIARGRRTKTTGLIQHVLEVLQEANAPMHVDDILKKLTENNHPVAARNPKATIAVALSRRTDQFRKTGPNTFALATVTPLQEAATMAS
jgi:hypothetical protein